jgi:hypothetical protein
MLSLGGSGLAVFAPEGGLEVMFDNAKATELRAPGSGTEPGLP